MADPENVIVHCPQGHELQAAREHLSTALACPVCGVEFVPASGATGATPPPDAVALSYAGTSIREPVEFPGITTPMIVLWVVGFATLTLTPLVAAVTGQPIPSQSVAHPHPLFVVTGFFECAGAIVFALAIVLQLIWIYRIHSDAKKGGGYASISPGLALGISFLIPFNFFWTVWTMRKLAVFASETGDTEDTEHEQRASAAKTAVSVSLAAAILVLILFCSLMSYSTAMGMKALNSAGGFGPSFDQDAYRAEVMSTIPSWVNLVTVGVFLLAVLCYYSAVRKLEAALYPALGAPPK